jgi:hypothetical protein
MDNFSLYGWTPRKEPITCLTMEHPVFSEAELRVIYWLDASHCGNPFSDHELRELFDSGDLKPERCVNGEL